jgi:hypothetical protein
MRIAGVRPLVYASFLAFSLVHCGGDVSSGGIPGVGSGNVDAFVGTWSCDSKSVIKVTTPAGTPDQTEESIFTFSVTKSSDSTIIAGDASNPSCSDVLAVSGSKASIKSPYQCTQDDGTMLKVTAESITVSGDKLTGTRTASLSATSNAGDPLAGKGTTTIACTRLSGAPDGGTGGTSGSDAAAGADGCANDSACVDCCSMHYPTGNDVLTNLLTDCTCQQCGTNCAASLCNGTNSTTPADGDPCETCVRQALGNGGPCVQRATNACEKNGDCSALAECLGTCPSGSPI